MSKSGNIVELVDTRGTFCPVPILLLARRARELANGAHLELLSDDPAILQDLPAWCRETGHRLVSMQEKGAGAGADGGPGARRTIHCVVELSTPEDPDP